MKYEAPLEPQLVDELFDFWLPIFEGQIDVTPDVLLGHELPAFTYHRSHKKAERQVGRGVSRSHFRGYPKPGRVRGGGY